MVLLIPGKSFWKIRRLFFKNLIGWHRGEVCSSWSVFYSVGSYVKKWKKGRVEKCRKSRGRGWWLSSISRSREKTLRILKLLDKGYGLESSTIWLLLNRTFSLFLLVSKREEDYRKHSRWGQRRTTNKANLESSSLCRVADELSISGWSADIFMSNQQQKVVVMRVGKKQRSKNPTGQEHYLGTAKQRNRWSELHGWFDLNMFWKRRESEEEQLEGRK